VLALQSGGLLLYWAKAGSSHAWGLGSAGAVVGGAVGNALDRVIQGAVIDFLNVSCCGIDNPYTFNIADIGVVVGAIGLLIFADKATPKA